MLTLQFLVSLLTPSCLPSLLLPCSHFPSNFLNFFSSSPYPPSSRVVRELIRYQHDTIHDEDEDANSPLHLACINGHLGVVKVLIASYCDVESRFVCLFFFSLVKIFRTTRSVTVYVEISRENVFDAYLPKMNFWAYYRFFSSISFVSLNTTV